MSRSSGVGSRHYPERDSEGFDKLIRGDLANSMPVPNPSIPGSSAFLPTRWMRGGELHVRASIGKICDGYIQGECSAHQVAGTGDQDFLFLPPFSSFLSKPLNRKSHGIHFFTLFCSDQCTSSCEAVGEKESGWRDQ